MVGLTLCVSMFAVSWTEEFWMSPYRHLGSVAPYSWLIRVFDLRRSFSVTKDLHKENLYDNQPSRSHELFLWIVF